MAVPFQSILCGVEGSESSLEAARQAIVLASRGGSVHFLAVYTTFELGPDYTKESLRGSLQEVRRMAEEAGVSSTAEMVEGKYAVDVLLPEAKKHDVLVIGTHDRPRAVGIVLGSTASEAAHDTDSPLLVARKPPGDDFPGTVLFASDGSQSSNAASRTAGRLAGAFDAELVLVHVDDGKHPDAAQGIEEQVAAIAEAGGPQPVMDNRKGKPIDQVIEAAEERRASLIVCGRRGLTGLKALGSVSERIVHQAKCPVLLVPHD